jgi:hypothetical protein
VKSPRGCHLVDRVPGVEDCGPKDGGTQSKATLILRSGRRQLTNSKTREWPRTTSAQRTVDMRPRRLLMYNECSSTAGRKSPQRRAMSSYTVDQGA